MGDSELQSSGSVQKQTAGPYGHGNELDMVQKPTNIYIYIYKLLRIPFIINTICLLQVSATLSAILREMHYKEYITIV
jgi:hypothetical protein